MHTPVKNLSRLSRDEKRRRALEDQKQRRVDAQMLKRQLSLAQETSKSTEIFMNPEKIEADEIPTTSDWFWIPLPVGQRCLVTSGNQKTLIRDESGAIIKRTVSNLPGGSHRSRNCTGPTLLECILSQGIFYVLDVHIWNGTPFYDCDAEFRFFWKQSQFAQMNPSTDDCQLVPFTSVQWQPLKQMSCL
ncbi:hypothetical protein EDD86DRAFT_276789 [Gorgonomyces haynaldii]|nr:hypothetical protein EDD86DRAFT_276789 [Gorgonomyces haynaldii]